MTKQIPDGDYELADGGAWLVVKNFSIRIRETKNGVSIGTHKTVESGRGRYIAPRHLTVKLTNKP